jgi:hypothetical protein
MKKIILFFLLLTTTLIQDVQAQCPTQITNPGGGTAYFFTLTNETQCASFPNGNNVTIGTGIYAISQCGDLTGEGTTIQVQLEFSSGTLVVLSTSGGVSFTLGMATCSYNNTGQRISLPIELLDFIGTPSVLGNVLTWTTASEKDNRHFDIERSTDGNTFHNIGQVKGNNKPSSYQFVDNQPFAASYYRLRQIDNDGKETLSKVISIATKGNGKLKAYPNPVSNTLTIETDLSGNFQILNLLGQQVLTGKTTAQRIDVSALPQGSYVLKVGAEQVKFVKQ